MKREGSVTTRKFLTCELLERYAFPSALAPHSTITEDAFKLTGTISSAGSFSVFNRGGPTMVAETRETGSLIGSDKVEGTAVYGANDTKIGSIERVMIDKMTGKVSYAVLSFGGFLGIGDDHYPLPWQSLKYDTNLGGYRTGITETQLNEAPKYGNDNTWDWADPARARSVSDYYGVAM
jgi:PRC-barrel domain